MIRFGVLVALVLASKPGGQVESAPDSNGIVLRLTREKRSWIEPDETAARVPTISLINRGKADVYVCEVDFTVGHWERETLHGSQQVTTDPKCGPDQWKPVRVSASFLVGAPCHIIHLQPTHYVVTYKVKSSDGSAEDWFNRAIIKLPPWSVLRPDC